MNKNFVSFKAILNRILVLELLYGFMYVPFNYLPQILSIVLIVPT